MSKIKEKVKLTPQESFLKQIEQYNDFITQNDLNVDKINPSHDFDFSAFTSPEDWTIESERLADRLSDRKLEIKMNENNEELQGLELEGGLPSFEAVQEMDEEQYTEYAAKYLDPSSDNVAEETVEPVNNYLSEEEAVPTKEVEDMFKKIDEQIKLDEARPEFADELQDEIIRQNHQRNGEPRTEAAPITVEDVVRPTTLEAMNKFTDEERATEKLLPGEYYPKNVYSPTEQEIRDSLTPKEKKRLARLEAREPTVLDKDMSGYKTEIVHNGDGRGWIQKYKGVNEVSTVPPLGVIMRDQTRLRSNKNTNIDNNSSTVTTEPSPLDLKSLLHNSLPYPVKTALDSALEAVNSGKKVMSQGQLLDALQDSGRGVMSGMADTAGSIADIGGLVPNRIADTAHESSKYWKDLFEIPDSEAGRIGTNVGTEAAAALLGGTAGKIVGNGHKSLKVGGETLRKSAAKVANDRQKMADDSVDYSHKFLNKIDYPASIRPNKISYKDAAMVRQNSYENLTKKSPYKSLNSGEPLTDVLSNNIKRNFDNRAMLKRNDVEIESLLKQGIPLDDALRIQQEKWNAIPNVARDAGLLMGIAAGQ